MTDIADLQIAELCVAIYDGRAEQWDYLSDESPTAVRYGVKRFGDTDCVIFEGTVDPLGWRENFDAWPRSYKLHPQFGPVHEGFFDGLPSTWTEIQRRVGIKVIVGGHSRGAAQARLMTALMIADGFKPIRCVVFGSPRAGFRQLADFSSPVPEHSYLNCDAHHHDLVTDVPYYFPRMPYVHRGQPIRVSAVPDPQHAWGAFAWHHMPLYRDALRAVTSTATHLTTQPAAGPQI